MFGHDDSGQQDSNYISDRSIDGAMGADSTPPATPSAFPSQPPADPTSQPMSGPDPSSPDTTDASAPTTDDSSGDTPATTTNDLIDIKQQALTQLSPLLGHLDQSPEEKFRTTMMMIQASDNQSLIKAAYEAAQQIEDEKTRAQAFLDVVNEINYFTQQHETPDSN